MAAKMKGTEFRAALPERVRLLLPTPLQGFKHRTFFSLVQFWYEEPTFHFEAWPQHKYNVMEIGLHLEHREAERNARLHRYLDERFIEIRVQVGEVWLERWDHGWHKLYKTLPLVPYSEPFIEQVAQELARQIEVLQPMLAEILVEP